MVLLVPAFLVQVETTLIMGKFQRKNEDEILDRIFIHPPYCWVSSLMDWSGITTAFVYKII